MQSSLICVVEVAGAHYLRVEDSKSELADCKTKPKKSLDVSESARDAYLLHGLLKADAVLRK